jgi:alpha-D-xyloside xylohydrolase
MLCRPLRLLSPALAACALLGATDSLFAADQTVGGATIEPVAAGVWKLHFGSPEEFVPTRFRSAPIQAKAIDGLGAATLPFDLKTISFKQLPRGVVVQLPLAKKEQIYGLGVNLQVNNHTGLKQRLCPSDLGDSMNDGNGKGVIEGQRGHSHAPVPFYVTTQGYGIYVDTARYATFYCGTVERNGGPSRVEAGSRGAMATGVTELYAARALTADKVIVDVPSARGLDVYVFAGPELKQAVQRFNLFSGGGPLPPMWGLGTLYRGMSRMTGDEAVTLAKTIRDDQVPCDIFGLEPGWQQQTYSSSWTFNKDRWPNAVESIAQIKALGYHVNLWEQAFIHPTNPLHEKLKPLSGDYLVWNGLVPDFALPETRKVVADYQFGLLVDKAGASGFKLDECDHQPISATPWSFPEVSAFPSGMDGEQMHALFGLLYQQTLSAPFVQRDTRTLGQVRNSWAMGTPEPYVIYSDWYEHHDYVRGLSAAGYSGLLWQPEVRHAKSIEDLYRRMQTAVMSPQTVINCWYLRMPPWKQIDRKKNNDGVIMDESAEATVVCRDLLSLRASLIPYLYTAYNDYHTKGVPPSRGMAHEWPHDEKTWGIDDQYLLGDNLLVAPLFVGDASRTVYLPTGDWYDFWTNEKFTGGQEITVKKPLSQIPIFVRGGTILPLSKPTQHVAKDTCFEITARVYGGTPATVALYEDDGETMAAARGEQQNVLTLRWDGKAGAVTKTGTYTGPARYQVVKWDVIK